MLLNGEDGLIVSYMISQGLINMRDNGIADTLNYEVQEIDFTTLSGTEFGAFSMEEIKKVPIVEVAV